MDESLDDIIKKKKIGVGANKKKGFNEKKPFSIQHKTIQRRSVADARIKIIERNRAKIGDAREKLAVLKRPLRDARELLKPKPIEIMRHPARNIRTMQRAALPLPMPRHNANWKPRPIELVRSRAINRFVPIPRGYIDYDNMERLEEEEYAATTRLSRTVRNDIALPFTPYKNTIDLDEEEEDVEMVEAEPTMRRMHAQQWQSKADYNAYHEYKRAAERRYSPERAPPKPIARADSPEDLYRRRYVPDSNSQLSYELRTRLEHAPDPHASNGIFASSQKPAIDHHISGYRIVVSNLHPSVSEGDVVELFSDVGELHDSRIVRPGVAEVIYKKLADAEQAVEAYHNRQLDGQPMKCLLVTPRVSDKPTAPAIRSHASSTSRMYSKPAQPDIDIDALHKVLFRHKH